MMISMKSLYNSLFIIILIIMNISIQAQSEKPQVISYEDYVEGFIDKDETFLSTLEEWQNVIEQWLEKPLCINNEDAELLVEYKIISLFQLNKLKEYRLMYGDLLSVYELSFIEGWDFQTVRKVMPLVTTSARNDPKVFKEFAFSSLKQNIILKTSIASEKGKGYEAGASQESGESAPYYAGSPFRIALRYDLEYRNRIAIGFRMEKDPGEPLLFDSKIASVKLKTPDLCTGYLLFKQLGPFKSIIIGNYRVNFGYGVNLSGGFSGIEGRNGMSGMVARISPQTSVSESGYFRGAAACVEAGKMSVTGFASMLREDGTSIVTDSLTGNVLSFSSISKSGLHRSAGELESRKQITEQVFGGFLVFKNNWLKTGVIGLYNRFNAEKTGNSRPYAKFDFSGRENLVAGISATAWFPKLQWLGEASVSKNKGMAYMTGFQFVPVPGALISFTYRNFDINYQNLYGSGFISSGKNNDEKGLQCKFRIELPKKYLIEILADESLSNWVSYDLAAPSRQREISISGEKSWTKDNSIHLVFRNINSTVKDINKSEWICHTANLSQYRIRLEARIQATAGVRLKSRLECSLVNGLSPGWLIMQDIEIAPEKLKAKFWIRTCLFDAKDFESRIYAYENDVLYDFSSFAHYGKGLRGIVMIKLSPYRWMDLWLRLSTVYYTNKYIGTGWDETGGNRQNEAEIQLRLKLPG
jgi:hypothetical protein